MTPGEIKRSYEQAANPKKQIKVLAELNDCTVGEIEKILGLEVEEPIVEKTEPTKSKVLIMLENELEEVEKQITALEEKYRNIVTAMAVIGDLGL